MIDILDKSRTVERFLNHVLVTKFAGLVLEELMQDDELGLVILDLYRHSGWTAAGYPTAASTSGPEMWIQYGTAAAFAQKHKVSPWI